MSCRRSTVPPLRLGLGVLFDDGRRVETDDARAVVKPPSVVEQKGGSVLTLRIPTASSFLVRCRCRDHRSRPPSNVVVRGTPSAAVDSVVFSVLGEYIVERDHGGRVGIGADEGHEFGTGHGKVFAKRVVHESSEFLQLNLENGLDLWFATAATGTGATAFLYRLRGGTLRTELWFVKKRYVHD